MIVHLVATAIFWLNYFRPSKPGTGLSNTKVPRQLVIRTVVDYKKILCIHPGEYVQVHQENEPRNKIGIDRTVREIVLGPNTTHRGAIFRVF